MADQSEPQVSQSDQSPSYAPPPSQPNYGAYATTPPAPVQPPPKNRRTAWIVVAAVAALLLVGAGIGVGIVVSTGGKETPAAAGRTTSPASTTSAASSTPTLGEPSNVGTPVQAPPASPSTLTLGASLALISTDSTSGATSTADVIVYGIQAQATSTNIFSKPTGQYVKVDVGTSGTSAASFPYNALDLVLQDTAGQIYQPTFAAGFDPAYNSGQIAQGQTVRGFVVFDIPAAALVKQVNYQVQSGVLGSWALP